MELINIKSKDIDVAWAIINDAKEHLKEQGIDQWQTGYPDYECIRRDAMNEVGYFCIDGSEILAYMCIDFSGEKAYDSLIGEWSSNGDYVVVHRLAITKNARGKKITSSIFKLIEEMSAKKGIHNFRVDTDEGNLKMQHILKKNGFSYRGKIVFDNSEKIAFDKIFE